MTPKEILKRTKRVCDCIHQCCCNSGDLKRKLPEDLPTQGELEEARQLQDIKKRRLDAEEWLEEYSGPSEWDWETYVEHFDWELPQTTDFDIEG